MEIIIAALAISLILNGYQIYKFKQFKARPKSQELVEFIHELTGGGAFVEIRPVNSEEFFWRPQR